MLVCCWGGEILLLVTYVSLCTENKSKSITCKFADSLHVHVDIFSLCFTRCKIKKYKQRQNKRIINRKTRAKEREKVGLCGFVWSYQVNCAYADRVTSNISLAHLQFLQMLKETWFFMKSSAFRWVPIEANVGNIAAMHSFFPNHAFFRKLRNI